MTPKDPRKKEKAAVTQSKAVDETEVVGQSTLADALPGIQSFTPKLAILPPAQKSLWPALHPLIGMGFVLYGGTAVALRLGHRESVDFDFFTERRFDPGALLAALPFGKGAQVLQEEPNTLTLLVDVPGRGVKVSFFGGFPGRVAAPEITKDGALLAASMTDLLATKLKVMFDRVERKDYLDIYGILASGITLEEGLAAAIALYGRAFQPANALRGLAYFKDGDLSALPAKVRKFLAAASAKVDSLPPTPRIHPILGVGP